MNGSSRKTDSKSEHSHLRDWAAAISALIWLVGFASIVPCEANAQALTIAETETLVRSLHYEGLPEEQALRIDAAGAARLVEMLGDPSESRAHANILIALGLCGEPDALDAIEGWAENLPAGEIDRHAFRAWQALPFALGNLAQHDARALARLEARLDAATPEWTFRHHRGAKLHRLERRAAATALGRTGLPAAAAALDRVARRSSDPEFAEHLRSARALHRKRSQRSEAR